MIVFIALILAIVLMAAKLFSIINSLTNHAPELWDGPTPDLGDAARYNDRLLKLGVITEQEHRANLDQLANRVTIDFKDLFAK